MNTESFFVALGRINAFGHDINAMEMMFLATTILLISFLMILVYKIVREFGHGIKFDMSEPSLLPFVHERASKKKWVQSRQQQYGKLGTIMEEEEFTIEYKKM